MSNCRAAHVAMVPESECDARVAPIYKRYKNVQTTILAGVGEVQLHLKSRAATLATRANNPTIAAYARIGVVVPGSG